MPEKEKTSVTPPGKKVAVKSPRPANDLSARRKASLSVSPALNASAVIQDYSTPFGKQDIVEMTGKLAGICKEVNAGDMKTVEAMLISQAHALQAMFTDFARRAQRQHYQSHLESFFRMALKAQNQCRMTLETLATIKNPPVVIARQANINHGGQQQVNNGTVPPPAPRAGGTEIPKTKLLEQQDGERLDFGAAGTPSGVDSQLEALGAVHRSQNGGGKGDIRAQRSQGRSRRSAKFPPEESGSASGAS